MPDHTEREREAREVVMRGIVDTLRTLGHPATLESLDSVALDAYRAAVRAAVLAEVRAKVEAQDTFTLDRGLSYDCRCDMKREPDAEWLDRVEVLDALTALEATDAGRL